MSKFHSTDHKRILSSRLATWVGMKMRGSVSLLDQSIRTRRNGGRNVLGWGVLPWVCWELLFNGEKEKSSERMWGWRT